MKSFTWGDAFFVFLLALGARFYEISFYRSISHLPLAIAYGVFGFVILQLLIHHSTFTAIAGYTIGLITISWNTFNPWHIRISAFFLMFFILAQITLFIDESLIYRIRRRLITCPKL